VEDGAISAPPRYFTDALHWQREKKLVKQRCADPATVKCVGFD